jgi:hypothetical protein
MKTEGADSAFRVETTKPTTAEREGKKWAVKLRTGCSIDQERTWIFTDGSGTGSHAAVILRPGAQEQRVAGCNPTSSRNVGAEVDGVILGLEHTVPGELIAIVSDFLWTVYYINGWYRLRDPYLLERVPKAREILKERGLADALFVYHRGHQTDTSDFSRWNNIADRLCRKQGLAREDNAARK